MNMRDYYRGKDDAAWGSIDYRAVRENRDYGDGVYAHEREQEERRAEEASRRAAQEHEWAMERQREEDAERDAQERAEIAAYEEAMDAEEQTP